MRRVQVLVAACALGLSAAAVSAAPVIAFDDAFQNGCSAYEQSNVTSTVVDMPLAGQPSNKAIEFVVGQGGAWTQPGVNLAGMVATPTQGVMQFSFLVTSGSESSVKVQLNGQPNWDGLDFGTAGTSAYWAVDGVSGVANPQGFQNAAADGQWHTMTLDLAGAFTSQMAMSLNDPSVQQSKVGLFHVGFLVSSPGTFYMDNVQVVSVPEPATLGLAGLSMLAGLARRRRA